MKNIKQLLKMPSVWKPASVTQEPNTILTQWRVFKVAADATNKESTIHFVGYAGYEGRVCSPVIEYDPETHKGVTKSGRVYELAGRSGFNSDAMYVWRIWKDATNAVTTDITEQY